jgi:hypothetical protein
MPNPLIATVGLGAGSAAVQASAARRAGNQQAASAEAGIAEQRRQFDAIQALLAPYVANGRAGLSAQVGLMGLRGPEEQARAIQGIEGGAEFAALTQQGENAILQNASATGGLRGGNTQGALAQFRPQVLNSLINQQLSRYGGLAQMGQSSAAMQANAGQASANNVTELLSQQGAARAGASVAGGQAFGNFLGGVGGLVGRFGIPESGIPQGQTMTSRWGF